MTAGNSAGTGDRAADGKISDAAQAGTSGAADGGSSGATLPGIIGAADGARRVLPLAAVGRTGLRITRLVFGGAPIGDLFSAVSESAARETLEAAWSAGIRTFDTAPHYGAGLSEQRIGSFLAGRPRPEYVLSTKVGRLLVPTDDDVEGAESFYGAPQLARIRDYSRDGVLPRSRRACDGSAPTGSIWRSSTTRTTTRPKRWTAPIQRWPSCGPRAWSARSASG
jgi:hypothetical protein